MARSIRKNLIIDTEQAQKHIDALDALVYDMDVRSAGRQPAIDAMKGVMIRSHEEIRKLWKALRAEL